MKLHLGEVWARGQSNQKARKEARSPRIDSDERDLDTPERGKEDLISIRITAGEQNPGQGRKEMHPKGDTTHPFEQREGISVFLTATGAGPPSKLLTEQLGPSETSHRPKEDIACQWYIGTPGQREGVSSHLPVVEEGKS